MAARPIPESRSGIIPPIDLLENARAIAEGETDYIGRLNLLAMVYAFGGREWIGHFSSSAHDYGRGAHERVVALCLAHVVLMGMGDE